MFGTHDPLPDTLTRFEVDGDSCEVRAKPLGLFNCEVAGNDELSDKVRSQWEREIDGAMRNLR